MRVILDANVAIAAVAARGLCEAVVELCLEHHQVILCEEILHDVAEKLRRKLKVAPPVVAEFVRVLRHNAEVLAPEMVQPSVCRDPDDHAILGLVAPGRADAIVTGDDDLLTIRHFKGAQIMTPRAFWEASKKH